MQATRRNSLATVVAFAAAFVATTGRAAAQPAADFTPDASEPEPSARRVAAHLKVGPSFGLARKIPTQFSLEIDGAYALLPDRLYATFSPQFNVGKKGGILAFPLGLEYDAEVADAGPGKVVAYPRFNMGYARFTAGRGSNAVAFMPELGVKWVLKDRFEAGLEPMSFAFYAGDGGGAVAYRMYLYGGLKF